MRKESQPSIPGIAFKNSLAFFGEKRSWIIGVLILIVGPLFGYFVQGKREVIKELETILIYTLCPMGAVAVLVFLWNLWLAPFKSLESTISDLKHPGSSTTTGVPTLERADLRRWKQVSAFEVWKVADLCAGLSPVAPTVRKTDAARAAFEQLSQAVECREIIVGIVEEGKPPGHKIVTRSELKRYFDKLGEVPEFLR